MYVTAHENVSILYADVVKYAQLTVSLPVNKLVEILNELFGRFDEASEVINNIKRKRKKRKKAQTFKEKYKDILNWLSGWLAVLCGNNSGRPYELLIKLCLLSLSCNNS